MRAFALIAALFLIGAPVASARQPVPAVQIVDAESAVELGSDPVPVRLLNTTGRPVAVVVAANATAADRSSAVVEVRQGEDVVVGPVTIAAGGDLWLTVALVGTPPRTPVSGYFTATADELVARRPITVAAPAEESMKPAVSSWETSAAPVLWGDPDPLPGRVPMESCPEGAREQAPVVSGHDTATVVATCAGGSLALRLTDVSWSGPSRGTGEFSGTLTLGGEEVAVTVARSSAALTALLWLLGGIGLTVVGLTVTGDIKPFTARRNAITDLKGPEGGPLTKPFESAQKDLAARLTTKAGWPVSWRLLPWPGADNAERLAAIGKDTDALAAAVRAAGAYAPGRAALTAHGDLLERWFPGMSERFAELDHDPGELGAQSFVDLVADLKAVPDLVTLGGELDRMAETVRLSADSPDQRAARGRVNQLAAALGRLSRPADAAGLADDVAETTARVDRLVDPEPPQVAITKGNLGPLTTGGVPLPRVGTVDFGRVVGWLTGRAGDLVTGTGRAGRLLHDGAAVAIAALVALWTGFAALYVAADSWGTVWDVVAAVLWGTAATAVSGPLVAALRRVGSRRQAGD